MDFRHFKWKLFARYALRAENYENLFLVLENIPWKYHPLQSDKFLNSSDIP